MTEREVVVAALVVAVAAGLAIGAPWWLSVGSVVAAAVIRRPVVVMAALAVAAGVLGARAEAGLTAPSGRVEGVATLVTDPQPRPGGVVVELRLSGRRFRSFVGEDLSAQLRQAAMGEEVLVRGSVVELDGPWEWRASRHLAGRLRVLAIERVGPGDWWWTAANWVHRTVDSGLGSFDEAERSLFSGILFGDDRGQSEVDRFRFRSAGMSHLTAVSGQNVGFVLLVLSPLIGRVRLGARWGLTALALSWFAMVTRLEPSVLRAVAMAMVAATVLWWGRYASVLRVLAVAVIVVLMVDPLLVWSMGFRLSVAACASIVVLARPLAERIPGPPLLAQALAVALAAHAGTAPVLVSFAGTVPVLGPVWNLLAVPVAGWLMVWGLVTAPLAGIVGEPFATMVGVPSRAMLSWLEAVAAFGASPGWPRWSAVGAFASSALVVLAALPAEWLRHLSSMARRATLAALVVLALADGAGVLAGRTAVVGSANVESGDQAIVLILKPGVSERVTLEAVSRCRCRRLDVVFVLGRGRSAANAVWSVREVVEVGTVFAQRPDEIRDAHQLPEGVVRVGHLRLDVRPTGAIAVASAG